MNAKTEAREVTLLSEIPARITAQMREHPYRTIGIACAAGIGAGIALSSRAMRSGLFSTLAIVGVQLARAYMIRAAKRAVVNASAN